MHFQAFESIPILIPYKSISFFYSSYFHSFFWATYHYNLGNHKTNLKGSNLFLLKFRIWMKYNNVVVTIVLTVFLLYASCTIFRRSIQAVWAPTSLNTNLGTDFRFLFTAEGIACWMTSTVYQISATSFYENKITVYDKKSWYSGKMIVYKQFIWKYMIFLPQVPFFQLHKRPSAQSAFSKHSEIKCYFIWNIWKKLDGQMPVTIW